MTTPSPDAAYDALAISSELSIRFGGSSTAELHAVSYLSCLLSVYSGRPGTDWGYDFTATETITPFSTTLLDATERLVSAGLLKYSDGRYSPTSDGLIRLNRWQGMYRFQNRMRFIEGSIGATDALPLPALSNGIQRDPQISGMAFTNPRPLLDDFGQMALYKYFKTLEEALGVGVDLLIPAVVWLTYLLRSDQDELADPVEETSS